MAEVKRFLTPVFRLSFPHLFEAQSFEGGPPKYSCSAVWTPSKFTENEKKLWKALMGAMNEESKNRFKKLIKDLPANYKKGIRDGNEKPDMEGYGEGTKFANLTTKMQPGIINRDKTRIHPDEGNDEEIYPGCYCRATVTIYSYDNKGKGIALGLMNVQKVADGERLDSRTDASEDFEEIEDTEWMEDESLLDDDDEDDADF